MPEKERFSGRCKERSEELRYRVERRFRSISSKRSFRRAEQEAPIRTGGRNLKGCASLRSKPDEPEKSNGVENLNKNKVCAELEVVANDTLSPPNRG